MRVLRCGNYELTAHFPEVFPNASSDVLNTIANSSYGIARRKGECDD